MYLGLQFLFLPSRPVQAGEQLEIRPLFKSLLVRILFDLHCQLLLLSRWSVPSFVLTIVFQIECPKITFLMFETCAEISFVLCDPLSGAINIKNIHGRRKFSFMF